MTKHFLFAFVFLLSSLGSTALASEPAQRPVVVLPPETVVAEAPEAAVIFVPRSAVRVDTRRLGKQPFVRSVVRSVNRRPF